MESDTGRFRGFIREVLRARFCLCPVGDVLPSGRCGVIRFGRYRGDCHVLGLSCDLCSRLHRLVSVVIKEAKNYSIVQSDETTELSYLVLSVPKNLSYDEKMRRLALLADKVTGVEDSDAICIAAWVPSESEQ